MPWSSGSSPVRFAARQLSQRDLVALGDTVDELADRIVEAELALLGELQHPVTVNVFVMLPIRL